MEPGLVDQLLQMIIPVALALVAMQIGSKTTGFGGKFVQKFTTKVTQGVLAIAIIWIVIAVFSQTLCR